MYPSGEKESRRSLAGGLLDSNPTLGPRLPYSSTSEITPTSSVSAWMPISPGTDSVRGVGRQRGRSLRSAASMMARMQPLKARRARATAARHTSSRNPLREIVRLHGSTTANRDGGNSSRPPGAVLVVGFLARRQRERCGIPHNRGGSFSPDPKQAGPSRHQAGAEDQVVVPRPTTDAPLRQPATTPPSRHEKGAQTEA